MLRFLSFFFILVLYPQFFFAYSELAPPSILIKIPTRAREQRFFTVLDQYYSKLSNKLPVHFVISCDEDDQVMNKDSVRAKFATYKSLSYYFGNSKSKIETCNKDLEKHLDFDILILGSDDMIPLVQDYDLIIAECMMSQFPDYDGVVHFNDGHQGSKLITLPILGRKFYERFGYVYNPAYKSFFCDNELTDVCKILNKVAYYDTVLIKHDHPGITGAFNDALYVKNSAYWDFDKRLYHARKLNNFELNDFSPWRLF
jgi:hypothetical protein